MKGLSVLVCVAALASGCHRRGPAPAYPSPHDPPLEEGPLAPYLEHDADGGAPTSDAGAEPESTAHDARH